MFHDRVKIYVEGGAGGNGAVSFRREAHVPRGGPDGGDGGHGGDVVLLADGSRRDLAALRFSPHHRAGRGGHGQGKQRHGARGEDDRDPRPARHPGRRGSRAAPTTWSSPGQRAIVAEGGPGGHGNKRFTSSTRQAPRFAERGLPGESGWIELRLKLLADAGLVGLPNAGKSSLLARMTRAAPKVADYPFTTLEPMLGTIDDGDRQLVIADIPGLIEGAAEGAGLGHEFLAHVERCRVLVHLVAIDPLTGGDPVLAYGRCGAELGEHGAGLADLPEIIVISKLDLAEAGEVELVADELPRARRRGRSGGLDLLGDRRGARWAAPCRVRRGARVRGRAGRRTGRRRADPGSRPSTSSTRRPAGAASMSFARMRRSGCSGAESRCWWRGTTSRTSRRSPIWRQRLREIGVVAALERAGFEPGDEVRIGDEVFELE